MTIPVNIVRYLDRCGEPGRRIVKTGLRPGMDQAVIIPALAEGKSLFDTLVALSANSLENMDRTLVLCVINNRKPGIDRPDDIEQNQRTLVRLDRLIHGHPALEDPVNGRMAIEDRMIREACPNLAYLDASSSGMEMPVHNGGVGMARKLGMDTALGMFDYGRPSVKLLFCLDADTRVEPNYLSAVRRFFEKKRHSAAVIDYAHPMNGEPALLAAICCYEIFLRYYSLGLRAARSPYAYHAIGSTMVCTADGYAAVGGMNRREAGEDFYFLNKLAKLSGIGHICDTTVYPSARASHRVPFGTGQRVLRFLEGRRNEYLLYHPDVFAVLGRWLALMPAVTDCEMEFILDGAADIHPRLRFFLEENRFHEAWPRIRWNHRHADDLSRHFHAWFDGFRTLKLVHDLTEKAFPPVNMFSAVKDLLRAMNDREPLEISGQETPSLDDQLKILHHMRRLSRSPVLP
jgi:hypothetical protein